MEQQQGQNGRREMYILSLDNNRIFWILSIALLVLVFLFLLGYWIGQDNSGGTPQQSTRQRRSSVDDRLGSLRRMLDSRRPAQTGMGGTLAGNTTGGMQQGSGDKIDTPSGVKKPATDPGFKTDTMSPRERRELAMLKKDAPKPIVKNNVSKRTVKQAPVRRSVVRKTVRRRSPKRSVYSSRGKYAIQVASLGTSGGASRLRSRLASRSFRAFVSRATVNGKRYYRIKVGRFSSYSRARQVLASLKRTSYGRRSYIVTN